MVTKLDQLNQLLLKEDLPQFRKTVSPSGGNLPWLKKHLRTDNAELAELVQLSHTELLKPV